MNVVRVEEHGDLAICAVMYRSHSGRSQYVGFQVVHGTKGVLYGGEFGAPLEEARAYVEGFQRGGAE